MLLNEIKQVLTELGRSPVRDTLQTLGVSFRTELSKGPQRDVDEKFGTIIQQKVLDVNPQLSESEIKKAYPTKAAMSEAVQAIDTAEKIVLEMLNEFTSGLNSIHDLQSIASSQGFKTISEWTTNIIDETLVTNSELIGKHRNYIENQAFTKHPEKIQSAIMKRSAARAWTAASVKFIQKAVKQEEPEQVIQRVEAMYSLLQILKMNLASLKKFITDAMGTPPEIKKEEPKPDTEKKPS